MKLERGSLAAFDTSPKRNGRSASVHSWYDFYAGFSSDFVSAALRALSLPLGSRILDPWNGSGTTSATGQEMGMHAIGFDINPAMLIIARAKTLSAPSLESVLPLAKLIAAEASANRGIGIEDPLTSWFQYHDAVTLRSIERSIRRALVVPPFDEIVNVNRLSDIAAFFLNALFSVARSLAKQSKTKNPTWVRKARRTKNVGAQQIYELFIKKCLEQCAAYSVPSTPVRGVVDLQLADSRSLPLGDSSISATITSPPYCTRLDYAVSTRIELAAMGMVEADFDRLRARSIGTTRVPKSVATPNPDWGPECLNFLEQVRSHPSKASRGYYYKNHFVYFESLHQSMAEISRVTRPGGSIFIVVQDSFYKEVLNPLSKIVGQMGERNSLSVVGEYEFVSKRDMARVNIKSRIYNADRQVSEVVVWMRKHD